jgi:PHD/YefM family antitoxin component YafN of YafNO toxin-antitoxin module
MRSNRRAGLDLDNAVERVRRTREHIAIRENGRIVAAIVSAEDLKDLEQMDRNDARLARAALARARARGEKPIPITKAKKVLGL